MINIMVLILAVWVSSCLSLLHSSENGAAIKEMSDHQRVLLLVIGDYTRTISEVGISFDSYSKLLESAVKTGSVDGGKEVFDVGFINQYVEEVRSALDAIKADPDTLTEKRPEWIKLYAAHYSTVSILAGEVRRRVADSKYITKKASVFCDDLDSFKDDRDRPLLNNELSETKQFIKDYIDVVSRGDYSSFARNIGYTARIDPLPGEAWIAREMEQYKSIGDRLTTISNWMNAHKDELAFAYFPTGRIAIFPTGKGAGWRRLLVAVNRKTSKVGFMNCE